LISKGPTENAERLREISSGALAQNQCSAVPRGKIIGEMRGKRKKIFVLAQNWCLWKSCEWHVNGGAALRTFFACSITDSARESNPVKKQVARGRGYSERATQESKGQYEAFQRVHELQSVKL
jgi:hypothetical protein